MSARRKFYDHEKDTVYEQYDGRCSYCGNPVSRDKMTISHRIPLSRGGSNAYENLKLACRTCNLMVGNLTFPEFVDKVTEILEHNNL